jgi:hypothetical protein
MTGSPSSEAVNSGAYLKPRGLQILFIWIWQSGIFVRLSHPPPDAPGRQFVDYHLQPSHVSRLLSVYRLQNRDRALNGAVIDAIRESKKDNSDCGVKPNPTLVTFWCVVQSRSADSLHLFDRAKTTVTKKFST